MESTPYVYAPIKLGEIRLMTLLPGKFREPVRCELNGAQLPTDSDTMGCTPSYEALSYMWGIASPPGVFYGPDGYVHIGTKKMFIRSNLLQALKRLRYIEFPRVLWVDAICINQASILERNEQVSRMRHIYRHATKVVVWVYDEGGVEDSSSDGQDSSCFDQIIAFGHQAKGAEPVAVGSRVVQFCCAPYWRRLWIIQEILSARELIIYCGAAYYGWNYLTDSLIKISASQKYETEYPSLMNTPIWILIRSLDRKESLTLRELLLRHGNSECEDKRDLVYGILGLASDCQKGEIPIDYAISTRELFGRVLALYAESLKPALLKRFEFHLRNILL